MGLLEVADFVIDYSSFEVVFRYFIFDFDKLVVADDTVDKISDFVIGFCLEVDKTWEELVGKLFHGFI